MVQKLRKSHKIIKSLEHFPHLQSAPYIHYTHSGYMVYCTISPDLKQQALLEEGWEIDQITAALGVHSKSIQRWENNYKNHYKNHGCIYPPSPLQGHCRLLSSDTVKELHKLLIESLSLMLDKIGEWLAVYHDQPISTTALHNNLKDLRLIYKFLYRIAME